MSCRNSGNARLTAHRRHRDHAAEIADRLQAAGNGVSVLSRLRVLAIGEPSQREAREEDATALMIFKFTFPGTAFDDAAYVPVGQAREATVTEPAPAQRFFPPATSGRHRR